VSWAGISCRITCRSCQDPVCVGLAQSKNASHQQPIKGCLSQRQGTSHIQTAVPLGAMQDLDVSYHVSGINWTGKLTEALWVVCYVDLYHGQWKKRL